MCQVLPSQSYWEKKNWVTGQVEVTNWVPDFGSSQTLDTQVTLGSKEALSCVG